MDASTSVLIVGGSLNALTMAMLLARRRLPCLVLERHPQTSIQYKFRGISPRSMEIYRSSGIEAEIRDRHLIDDRSASVARMKNLADSEVSWQWMPPSDTSDISSTTADRRIVVDEGVATAPGISASIPVALTLVEAIAGREKAEAVGRDIGVTGWDASHDSGAFQFTRPFAMTAIRNRVAFWQRETLGIELSTAVDEVSLALVADAWSRTYRSRAVTLVPDIAARESRNGIQIVPDRVKSSWQAATRLPAMNRQPAKALDEALEAIGARYGARTTDFVAMQPEYPTAPHRAIRRSANAFDQTAMTRSLR